MATPKDHVDKTQITNITYERLGGSNPDTAVEILEAAQRTLGEAVVEMWRRGRGVDHLVAVVIQVERRIETQVWLRDELRQADPHLYNFAFEAGDGEAGYLPVVIGWSVPGDGDGGRFALFWTTPAVLGNAGEA